ncbi:MAG: VOC family protein [Bacteroidetes bacterium]|nr:VOC family protein [Bacteroidota bacterium]
MSKMIKSLEPYLTFDGNCEEALNTYAKVFNGKVTIQQRYDNPAMKAPKEYHNKVLHASIQFDDIAILASDIMPGGQLSRGSSDVSLSLNVSSLEESKRIFEQLAEGGKVHHPFEKQFWGAWHGNLVDKYGIRWMVNCE